MINLDSIFKLLVSVTVSSRRSWKGKKDLMEMLRLEKGLAPSGKQIPFKPRFGMSGYFAVALFVKLIDCGMSVLDVTQAFPLLAGNLRGRSS